MRYEAGTRKFYKKVLRTHYENAMRMSFLGDAPSRTRKESGRDPLTTSAVVYNPLVDQSTSQFLVARRHHWKGQETFVRIC